MKNLSVPVSLCIALLVIAPCASAGTREAEKKGAREGKEYRAFLLRHDKVDGTACAVGMAAGDKNNPQYTQEEIEAYAKAFGNACMGRKVY